MPQNRFNEWLIINYMDPFVEDSKQLNDKLYVQFNSRLVHLRKTKELQKGVYENGLWRINKLLELFEENSG